MTFPFILISFLIGRNYIEIKLEDYSGTLHNRSESTLRNRSESDFSLVPCHVLIQSITWSSY